MKMDSTLHFSKLAGQPIIFTVGYAWDFTAPWPEALAGLVVVLHVLVAIHLVMALVANKQKRELLYKMMPPSVIRMLLRRGR